MLHEFNKLSLKTQNEAKLESLQVIWNNLFDEEICNLVSTRANVSRHAIKLKVGISNIII